MQSVQSQSWCLGELLHMFIFKHQHSGGPDLGFSSNICRF